jgi:FkbM family methyltransferase
VKRIDYSNIICGGGDDVLRFAPYIKNSMSSLLMFDPHPSQIKRYSFMFKKKSVKSMFKNLCLLPLALHNSNSVVNFSVSQFQRNRFSLSSGYGAMISSSGTLQVHSIKLDSIAMGFKPTFIALDIEGSELNALKGSKGIIKRFSPSLSIALYHSINHLWEIVIFLKKVNPNYNFYIRNYSSFCGETFLYAVDTR